MWADVGFSNLPRLTVTRVENKLTGIIKYSHACAILIKRIYKINLILNIVFEIKKMLNASKYSIKNHHRLSNI